MSRFNESDFEKLKSELESIEIPKDKTHAARRQAFTKYYHSRKRIKRTWQQVALVTILLIAFVTSIRVLPVFAQTIAKIPGFAPLVEMITQDKGVKDIIDNQYYEELGIVQTKNDLTLTLLGTIADESGMIIFYRLEAPNDISELEIKDLKLTHGRKDFEGGISYFGASENPNKIIEDKIEAVAVKKIDYSNPNFLIELTFDDANDTSFTVPFTLTKQIETTKTIEVNQQVKIDNQIINIESFKISPLRAEVQLSTDENNTMQILQINQLKVLDEKGEEWGKISNGIVGFGGLRENNYSIFIESNYFRKPESLTLVLDEIEVLPKGEDYIEIDFLKQEFVKVPELKDFKLSLIDFNSFDVSYKSQQNTQVFNQVIDANGNQFYTSGYTFRNADYATIEETYTFDLKDAVNPVRIYFHSYPNYLKGSAEIKIPLD